MTLQKCAWTRGRNLPALLLCTMFGLGCYTMPDRFRIVNMSSQTLELKGQHGSGVEMSAVLPPNANMSLKLKDRGGFSGSIQAADQRWSAPKGGEVELCFIDDPADNSRLALVPISGRIVERASKAVTADDDEYIVANRTSSNVLVIHEAGQPATLLEAGQTVTNRLPRQGDVTFRTIIKGVIRDVTLPRESDRVWEVRE